MWSAGLHISVVATLKVQCVWRLTFYCHKSDMDQIEMILKVWMNVVDEWMKGWTVGQTAWQLSQCNSIIGTGTGELRRCAVRTTKDRPSHFTPRFTPSPYKLNRSHFGVRALPSPSQNTLRTRWLVKPTKKTKQQKTPRNINDNVSPPTPTQTVHTSALWLETQTWEMCAVQAKKQHSTVIGWVHRPPSMVASTSRSNNYTEEEPVLNLRVDASHLFNPLSSLKYLTYNRRARVGCTLAWQQEELDTSQSLSLMSLYL